MAGEEGIFFWSMDSRKSGAALSATLILPVVGQVVYTTWDSSFLPLTEVNKNSFLNLLAKHEWKIKGQLKILY